MAMSAISAMLGVRLMPALVTACSALIQTLRLSSLDNHHYQTISSLELIQRGQIGLGSPQISREHLDSQAAKESSCQSLGKEPGTENYST